MGLAMTNREQGPILRPASGTVPRTSASPCEGTIPFDTVFVVRTGSASPMTEVRWRGCPTGSPEFDASEIADISVVPKRAGKEIRGILLASIPLAWVGAPSPISSGDMNG